jgi:hypothetical protein
MLKVTELGNAGTESRETFCCMLKPMDFILYFVVPKLFEHVLAGRHYAQKNGKTKHYYWRRQKKLERRHLCFRTFTLCLMLVGP